MSKGKRFLVVSLITLTAGAVAALLLWGISGGYMLPYLETLLAIEILCVIGLIFYAVHLGFAKSNKIPNSQTVDTTKDERIVGSRPKT